MRHREFVSVEVDRIVAETDGAVLVELDGEQVWVPRSQIDGGEVLESECIEIDVTEWFASKKGWL